MQSRSNTRPGARHRRALHRRDQKQYSPEHYSRVEDVLQETGVCGEAHAPSTVLNIQRIKSMWKEYCSFRKKKASLNDINREVITAFLIWMIDTHPGIRKQSTLKQYWRQWKMMYRERMGRSLHSRIQREVLAEINTRIQDQFELDLTMRVKPVMNVDDLYITLLYLWTQDATPFADGRQRLQLSLIMLMTAYTASRPAALVYVERNAKLQRPKHVTAYGSSAEEACDASDSATEHWDFESKTLCYEDVNLILLPNPGQPRDLLVMEVNLQYTKGHHRKPKRKIFVFSEVDDLVFDAIMMMVTIACHDDAFESTLINSVEDIFRIRVPQPRHSLRLRWKAEIRKVPVFRQAVPTADGVRTSSPSTPKALRYSTYLYYLQRLGFAVGFPELLRPYDLRRGAGEAVNANASQGVLQQVMNHKDAGIFQAYINERVQFDVQGAFLGRPSQDAILKKTSHMSRDIDPRAPVRLSQLSRQALDNDPEIVQCRELRNTISLEATKIYGGISKAPKDSKLKLMHKAASASLKAVKTRLKKEELRAARDEFFENIDTLEVNRSLEESFLELDLRTVEWKPEAAERSVELRNVASLLSPQEKPHDDQQQKLHHRINTIEALLKVCKLKDMQPKAVYRIISPQPLSNHNNDLETCLNNELTPPQTTYVATQCPLCLVTFSTTRRMREHAESQHLRHFKEHSPIACPHPYCLTEKIVLNGPTHFKFHAHKCHGVKLQNPKRRWVKKPDLPGQGKMGY